MAEKKYFPIAEAAKQLEISERTLRNFLPELKHGEHYQDRRKKGGRKAKYFVNIEAVVTYWNTKPERRK